MTTLYDMLIVGAGPAGVSAAIAAAERGASVLLVEQRAQPGGAIHRAAFDGGSCAVKMPARHTRNWAALKRRLDAHRERIALLTESVFIGIDGHGVSMIDSRADARVKLARARAVVFAIGATERMPRVQGWELPGVMTAGGLQVQIKESGQAPAGTLLIAGSGPLPLALGAQLCALGKAPAAILEAARPIANLCAAPRAAWGLAAGPHRMMEAAGYVAALLKARVPYRTGTRVQTIRADNGKLVVSTTRNGNACREYIVDTVVLHDGLVENARGIPTGDMHGVIVARAGDCATVLGADAALDDGRRVAADVLARLKDESARTPTPRESNAQRFQRAVGSLYAKADVTPDDATILCRCEGVTRQALKQQNLHSAREIRLVGRVGMGPCQGRFCAHAATTAQPERAPLTLAEIDGSIPRWPIRPVSLKALAEADDL